MEKRIKEIDERIKEIRGLLDKEGSDIDGLSTEFDQLSAEKKSLEEQAEKRAKLIKDISECGTVVRSFQDHQEEYSAASPAYKRAWLKTIATDVRGKMLFGDLTREERAAFTFTTANTGAVVPTEILNRIVTLIDNDSPMYDDSTKSNFTAGFEIARIKSITAGDAKVVAEGTANVDENDQFDTIALPGVEIKKHVVLSRKMQFQSIEAFENWIVVHLAERIRVAKEAHIITQLAKSETVGIDAGNIVTNATLDEAQIRRVIALLRGSGERVLYANSEMIWTNIAGIKDKNDNPLFMPSAMDDPLVEGRIFGTTIKRDSNIPDNVFYIGYPKKILSNEFITFDVTPQVEDKTLNRIFVGYSLFDAGLEDPKAFAKFTISPGK